jgi:hypothetical protein
MFRWRCGQQRFIVGKAHRSKRHLLQHAPLAVRFDAAQAVRMNSASRRVALSEASASMNTRRVPSDASERPAVVVSIVMQMAEPASCGSDSEDGVWMYGSNHAALIATGATVAS